MANEIEVWNEYCQFIIDEAEAQENEELLRQWNDIDDYYNA